LIALGSENPRCASSPADFGGEDDVVGPLNDYRIDNAEVLEASLRPSDPTGARRPPHGSEQPLAGTLQDPTGSKGQGQGGEPPARQGLQRTDDAGGGAEPDSDELEGGECRRNNRGDHPGASTSSRRGVEAPRVDETTVGPGSSAHEDVGQGSLPSVRSPPSIPVPGSRVQAQGRGGRWTYAGM